MVEKFKKQGIIRSYSTGPYNKLNDTEQWIRISQGCPNRCPFCYEPPEQILFPVPKIERNIVKVMDMNLLSQDDALEVIQSLGGIRINRKVVKYELVCGIDHRFLSESLAQALKESRFINIRMAWDFYYGDQFKIQKALKLLQQFGYKRKGITIFMVCNWKISYEECLKKLYLCAIWGVKVADCYFDGQIPPDIKPIGWAPEQIKDFRGRVRKHNQLINFEIDPEYKVKRPTQSKQ